MMRFAGPSLAAALLASAAQADGLTPEKYADAESLAMICSELAVMSRCWHGSQAFPNTATARADFLRKMRPVGLSDFQMQTLDLAFQRGEIDAMRKATCQPGEILDIPESQAGHDNLERSLAQACRP